MWKETYHSNICKNTTVTKIITKKLDFKINIQLEKKRIIS